MKITLVSYLINLYRVLFEDIYLPIYKQNQAVYNIVISSGHALAV